jgi:phosphohistidine phosphatase SixA
MKNLLRAIAFCLAGAAAPVAQAADAWAELAKPGAIVLFRHATAPGVGDPPGFKLEDCSTQRNLSEEGRAEARRLGEQFRARNIQVGAVLHSQWCRARDTARLAFGERAREEPAFNSTFGARQGQPGQPADARDILARWKGPGTLVVVTHQVNIQALAGVGAISAEGVVVRHAPNGALQVVATLQP